MGEGRRYGAGEEGGQLGLVSAFHIGLKAIFAFSRVFICDINWKKHFGFMLDVLENIGKFLLNFNILCINGSARLSARHVGQEPKIPGLPKFTILQKQFIENILNAIKIKNLFDSL